jgi:hypothetical protein
MHWATTVGLTMLMLAGCGSDVTRSTSSDGGSGGGGGAGGAGATFPTNAVTIDSVAMYQSVERVLSVNGAVQTSIVPIVAGRDALIRVFHSTAMGQAGQLLTGRLTIEGRDSIQKPVVLSTRSSQSELGSTFNFKVPGDFIDGAFAYRLDLLDGAGNSVVQYPAEGFESHAIDVDHNTLRVVLVPFQYDADGSGRLPDTSPPAVEQFKQRFTQLFPVSAAEVTVRAPVPWAGTISPFGEGMQDVMEAIYTLRLQDGVDPDTYYYGLFNPQDNLGSFCAQGCVLGVTALNNQPATTGDPELRWAIGVGYTQVAFDTSAHELGHSHGREHVDCGGPQSVDTNYPHDPQTIGVWGYDGFGEELIDPNKYTDMMGYCQPEWVSDYTFAALGARGKNVNLPDWHGPTDVRTRAIMFDGSGHGTFQPLNNAPPRSLGSIDVTIARGSDKHVVGGNYVPFDHIPGGILLYPERIGQEADRVEFSIDGKTLIAER